MAARYSTGTYLSGTAHAALVVWMVAGWGMSAEPLPFEVTEVSVVSGSEFAQLTQGVQPDQPPGDPAPIEPPIVDETPPTPIVETPPEVAETPPPVTAPAIETPPAAPDLTVPETVVTDTPPAVPDTPTIVAPPPSAELGVSLRPIPRPAPRVAPEIVAPPPPDATVAPDVAQAAVEDVEVPAEVPVEPEDETTAPEEAADQIVTEAEEPAFAPEISRRPATRPQRTAAVETPTEAPTETPSAADPTPAVDPVAAALAAAGATDTPGLSGGQLSDGDKSGFLRQVGNCWNTGTLSTGAQNTIVVMEFSMTPEGEPVSGSVQMESFSGGSAADADAAFQTARRALLRCSGDTGYDLPRDQYEQWQRVVLTVDPTAMRQR
ncbi:MAG: cell envelope biogenesis protein TolA [Yoonia sp.]|uniref:cell envelope biogenesis protein TolA n=1 Tax=Yoonia sp. TaxID=2212373 RepID=UPI003EF27503